MIHIFEKEVLGGKYPHSKSSYDDITQEKNLNIIRNKYQDEIRERVISELIEKGVDKDLAKSEAEKICIYLHHRHLEKIIHFKINRDEFSVLCDTNVKKHEYDRYTSDINKITCSSCKNKLKIK